MTSPLLRLGTRGSPLALAQTRMVHAALIAAWPGLEAPDAIEIVVIRTMGDRIQDRPLSAVGGKGLFTKELEEALLADTIDIAIHSVKDLPSAHQDGLFLACTLEREDPRDAIISRDGAVSLATTALGATIGTSALRRQSQILALRNDIRFKMLRGNVDTRLRKLDEGEVDAIMLAAAGLKRLGLEKRITGYIDPQEMLPAVGQGAVGCEIRIGDHRVFDYLQPLDHRDTHDAILAERAMLHQLEGNCRTPIAGYARVEHGDLSLKGLVATPDGVSTWRFQLSAKRAEARGLGREVGERIQAMAGSAFPKPD